MSAGSTEDNTAETLDVDSTLGSPDARSTLAPQGVLIGRYIVISRLGAGGMGVVFAAFDPELDRKVALKLLKHRPNDVSRSRSRLQREAQSLAKLDHPNVVRVFDVGVHEGQLFVAMEFVAGQTLGEWIAAGEGPRPWPELLEVFSAAGRGLAAAHAVGMVHRDFKPDNVMLGEDGRVRVMDFGLARGEEDADSSLDIPVQDARRPVGKLTQTGTKLGTPAYMSLEQFEGREVDARSDQFSFCVSLYEALYGRRPFAGETFVDLMEALRSERIEAEPESAGVPAWLRAVVLRGLARQADQRFESMRALLDALAADPRARWRSLFARGGSLLAVVGGLGAIAWLWTQRAELGGEVAEQREQLAVTYSELERQNAALRREKRAVEVASTMASAGTLSARHRFGLAASLLVEIDAPEAVPGWRQLALEVLEHQIPRLTMTHPAEVWDARWSPDSQRIVTACEDNALRIWSLEGSDEPIVLEGHTAPSWHAQWSPDGQRIVSGASDGSVRVWSVGTPGESLVLEGFDTAITRAWWSPDGERVLAFSEDASPVRIWNADGSGEAIVLEADGRSVTDAQWSPDGEQVLVASGDHARVWSSRSGRLFLTLSGHLDTIKSAAWSPDGQRIVTASDDDTARIWNADGSGEALVLGGHSASVQYVSWSPDGRRVATGSKDKMARIWDAEGRGEALVLEGHTSFIQRVEWSPDSRSVITASVDNSARIWSAEGRSESIVLEGHGTYVSDAVWSPDGRHVLTASEDGTARVWDAERSTHPRVLEGHARSVRHVQWSPDGERLLSAGTDASVRIWDLDGRGAPLVLEGHARTIRSVAWSPDGERVLSSSWDGSVRVWPADGVGDALVLEGHRSSVNFSAWSPKGDRIVTVSSDHSARVWSGDGLGAVIVLEGHSEPVGHAAWSPDGQRIVTASDDHSARIWSADGVGEALVLEGHSDEVWLAQWSPDGAWIATASADNTARVWPADGQGPARVLEGHTHPVEWIAWSPDGQHILTASDDWSARIWRADAVGEPLILRGHEHPVYEASWSPDGRYILTASEDNTARVWRADGVGEGLVLDDHTSVVWSAAWSPDGRRVATASKDNTVRIWQFETEALLAMLRERGNECLRPSLRQSLLAEARDEALARYHRCERAGGRSSFGGELSITMRGLEAADARTGGLARVRAALRDAPMTYDIERCYRGVLAQGSSFMGELRLEFRVDPRAATEAAYPGSGADDAQRELGSCLARALVRRSAAQLGVQADEPPLEASVTYALAWE